MFGSFHAPTLGTPSAIAFLMESPTPITVSAAPKDTKVSYKLELKVRESYYLKAVCENMPYATIIWRVNGEESGNIASDGTYTAPNIPGVYEVTAQCQEAPEIKASIFIVVRE